MAISKREFDVESGYDKYWFDLAEEYGLPREQDAAQLVYELYKIWPKDMPKFRDWVKHCLEQGGKISIG